jgi:hypothetical protein
VVRLERIGSGRDRERELIVRLGLLSQETDKATMDVEAQDEGLLAKIIVRSF